jgi:N-methylhydantoinase B
MPGGGERSAAAGLEAVARDVRSGFVSSEAAKRDYGVVVAADGLVDLPATAALRSRPLE